VPAEAAKPSDLFPLSVVASAVADLKLPTGTFDPKGDWALQYGLITVGQRGFARVGSVGQRRQARQDGGAVLRLVYEKAFPGNALGRVTAQMHCRGDALATPLRWQMKAQTLASDGKPVPHTTIEKHGEAGVREIVLRDGKATRKIPTPDAWTLNWALFDVVARLPRKPFEPLRFTLLDDFDELKPGQALSFRGTTQVSMGGRRVRQHRWKQLDKGRVRTTAWGREGDQAVRLHGYDLVGPGLVPVVYWVDDAGRPLAAIAGLEVYLLEAAP
jgi:hypothetical protein